jgi:hypothetical protein
VRCVLVGDMDSPFCGEDALNYGLGAVDEDFAVFGEDVDVFGDES